MLPLSEITTLYGYLDDAEELGTGAYEVIFDSFYIDVDLEQTQVILRELPSILVRIELEESDPLFQFADLENPRWVKLRLGKSGVEALITDHEDELEVSVDSIEFVSPELDAKLKASF